MKIRYVLLVLGILGTVAVVLQSRQLWRRSVLCENGIVTPARILNTMNDLHGVVEYEYQVDGDIYIGRSQWRKRELISVGDEVNVFYSPNHPNISSFRKEPPLAFSDYFNALGFYVFFSLFSFFLFVNYNEKWVRKLIQRS